MTAVLGVRVTMSLVASLFGLALLLPWSRRRSIPTARPHLPGDAWATQDVDPCDPYPLALLGLGSDAQQTVDAMFTEGGDSRPGGRARMPVARTPHDRRAALEIPID